SRDVQQLAAAGRFRDDLLQRINTVRIALPPLRERVVDIGLLAEHFVSLFGGANAPRLTEASRVALEHYRWPGNVSELRNVIERAVLLANDDIVEVRDLPTAFDLSSGARPSPSAPLTLSELERRHIQEVLDQTGWHQGRASDLLGISAKTLYRKIREYGFRRPSRLGGGVDGN
ncbi:MAG: sigma-54-dependent Fis family transcriptional regulator, partial [Gemmatimonadota bacterium]|nr:sigma-54-dependent Fis family transcriptional regulator [Gemmatimonadota bacterium]